MAPNKLPVVSACTLTDDGSPVAPLVPPLVNVQGEPRFSQAVPASKFSLKITMAKSGFVAARISRVIRLKVNLDKDGRLISRSSKRQGVRFGCDQIFDPA